MRTTETKSLYDQVTDRIIAELEEGRLPWVQPWDRAGASAGLPRNAGTGRCYSGINVLILWSEVTGAGYGSRSAAREIVTSFASSSRRRMGRNMTTSSRWSAG